MIGKIIFVNRDGSYGIKAEDKRVFLAWKAETSAKIKQGKSVIFDPGNQVTYPDGHKSKHRHALNVRNNTAPEELSNEELRQAIREYYDYEGARRIHLCNVVTNTKSGLKRLLVHFMDVDDVKHSALMTYEHWANGDWELTEVDSCYREEEAEMVKAFVESEEFV